MSRVAEDESPKEEPAEEVAPAEEAPAPKRRRLRRAPAKVAKAVPKEEVVKGPALKPGQVRVYSVELTYFFLAHVCDYVAKAVDVYYNAH